MGNEQEGAAYTISDLWLSQRRELRRRLGEQGLVVMQGCRRRVYFSALHGSVSDYYILFS